MPGNAIPLMIFGVTFAEFCVWLSARIIKRREPHTPGATQHAREANSRQMPQVQAALLFAATSLISAAK
jgi:hypothetical protein